MIENAVGCWFYCCWYGRSFIRGLSQHLLLQLLTRSMRADIGVMISASHNAYQDNGIKLFGPDGFKLSDKIEVNIERLLDERTYFATCTSK